MWGAAAAVYLIHARKCRPLKNAAVVSVAGYMESLAVLGVSFKAIHQKWLLMLTLV